jgi:hypothetical protein
MSTREEIDAQIKALQEQKKALTTSSYDARPVREKILYDLQPMKILTGVVKALIAIIIVAGIVFGIGFWRGKQTKPVWVDMKDFQAQVTCKYTGQVHDLSVRNYRMYFDNKAVTEGDIPNLKPYGIELHPKLFAGLGTKGPAMGAGFEVAHFYKLNLDVFLMSDKAAYVGISYDLKMDNTKASVNWFENSSIGLALGKGLSDVNETRIMLYWSLKF